MNQTYSRSKRSAGRKYFSIFEFINTISFSFLAGNLLTLLLLRLGAGDTLIGVLNSFIYVSFFFMPLGRAQVRKLGVVKNFGRSWVIRYLTMLPLILIPPLLGNRPLLAIPLIFAGYLGFQVFRGIGIVSINPILKELSAGADQGMFLSRLQILVHSGGILANLGVALLIGPDAPLLSYGVSIAIGSVLGVFGAMAFVKIPEPPGYLNARGGGTLKAFKEGLKEPTFRRFLPAFGLMIFFSSMFRPFVTVYAKQIYGLSDRVVLLLSLAGGLGAILMGMINRWMMDRVGSKPMIMIFTGVLQLSVLILLSGFIFPGIAGVMLLATVFFLSFMGSSGGETASQGYFFTIMPNKNQVELGIVYYLLMGIAGALGSVLGGWVLEGLKMVFDAPVDAFAGFFVLAAGGLLVSLFALLRLDSLSGRSVGEALSVLFSLRDWRAMTTIHHLSSSKTVDQEQKLLRRLRELGSGVSVEEVVDRLRSPLFRIRREALTTLNYLPYGKKIQDALLRQVEQGDFATAYPAARILGQRGTVQAIPGLKLALASPDPLLAGNAAVALAELGNTECRAAIETRMLTSRDKNFLVYGAVALRIIGDGKSIPVLYSAAEQNLETEYVVQEAAFSIGGILGLEDRIHRVYPEYRSNPELGLVRLAEDLAGSRADTILERIRSEGIDGILAGPTTEDRELFNHARQIRSQTRLAAIPAFAFLVSALVIEDLTEGSG